MSDLIKAILLGILEGLTEFIPVSSTGHLILLSDSLQFSMGESETFNIAIQLGAILAVVILYWSFFKSFFHPRHWISKQMKVIISAIFPVLILGFFFHKLIKSMFSPNIVLIGLVLGSLFMIVVEIFLRPKPEITKIEDIQPHQAFLIGLTQCFCLFPGFSRSGATIVGGLIAKLDYETSAKFSFIIAVPVMVAAVGYDLIKTAPLLSLQDLMTIGVGFIVAFIIALFSMLTFLKLLVRIKLLPFALYRLALVALYWILI